MPVQNLGVTESDLHVCDVVLALTEVISDIAELFHFVAQHAVECRARFEGTAVGRLPDFLADFIRKGSQGLVVRSQLQLIVSIDKLGRGLSGAA